MKTIYLLLLSVFLLHTPICNAQDIIRTSFEEYTLGNVNKQDKWTVTKGNVSIIQGADYAHTSEKGLKFENTSSLQADHIAYASNQEGLSGDVYVDFWIKINSIATGAFSITGYDLTSNSRSFMLEFSADGKIKIYNGSSGSTTIKPTYTSNTWTRISYKISNEARICKFALNGSVYEDNLNFREIKSSATSLDYHSIRFMQSGNCDIALDDLYIGSTPINDIDFGATNPGEREEYSLNVIQPTNAIISISPEPTDGKYAEGTKITANIAVNDLCKYRFKNWTNDISGTSLPITFTINKDMTIGADIVENPETSTTLKVSNYAELKSALESMAPGDIIELQDGVYSGNGLTVSRSGCNERPIIIKAKNKGKAKIEGKLYFTLRNVEYLTFEGLNFNLEPVSSIFKLEGCNNIRITQNEFRMKKLTDGQTSKWILIGDVWENVVCNSHHNRIDHNLFDGKYDGGAWVVIDGAHGTKPGDISKYDLIDHNHFRNNTPRADNEKETIRIGVSDLTPCSAYCTVEYNLFENCDGDPEIVSVKSCDNIVRGNTFRSCLGTVCLRQGSRNTVDGNYFFGEGKTVDGNGCGGIRVYGKDHKIINNYFEGLTGEKWDAACTITNGDAANTSTSWSAHFVPENVTFAFNTFVNNKSDIEIGFTNNDNYGKRPVNCTIANNVYIQNENPIIKAYSTQALSGINFSNNIMFSTGNASIGASLTETQARNIDPLFVKTNCRTHGSDCNNLLPYEVYKPTANSPTIDASSGNYTDVLYDFEGQLRTGTRDIGADEYNNSHISNGVLGAEHVGPNATEFKLNIVTGIGNSNDNESSVPDLYVDNKEVHISFPSSGEKTTLTIYDMRGIAIKTVKMNTTDGINMVTIPLHGHIQGIYFIKILNQNYKATRKFVLN